MRVATVTLIFSDSKWQSTKKTAAIMEKHNYRVGSLK